MGHPGSLGRILVVDDQPVNRKLVKLWLERLGFTVDTVRNGLEALEAMSAASYDLVLMDCEMPVMNGFQATEEIRRREGALRHTPIVALTASGLKRDREGCLRAGMDDYASKPLSAERLKRIVKRWIPSAPAIEEATISVLRQIDESDAAVLREVIGIYLEDTPRRIASMHQAVVSSNSNLLASAAHALKSSSGNVGATAVRNLCNEIEQIGRSGLVDGAAELLRSLELEFKHAGDALRSLQHT
jgi:two-component system sensor histidine kinase/response regulator